MAAYPTVGPPSGLLADPINEQMKRDKEAIYGQVIFTLETSSIQKKQ